MDQFPAEVFNLGSESGFSVKEVFDKATLVIGREIPYAAGERRPGDVAISVASATKAKEKLGWNPQYSNLDSIIRTDWHWRQKHPLGYTRSVGPNE
jgi:UDP-glucose 4-epimerase